MPPQLAASIRLSASPHGRVLEERPDIGAAVAADLTGEPRLQVRQSSVVTPTASVDHDRMRALVIAAVDDESARAGLAHFTERYFLLARHRLSLAFCFSQMEAPKKNQRDHEGADRVYIV
jgi:hypothetical protein